MAYRTYINAPGGARQQGRCRFSPSGSRFNVRSPSLSVLKEAADFD